MMKRFKILLGYLVVLLPVCCAASTKGDEPGLELPAIGKGEKIITYADYVVSYDSTHKIPRWVAYELTAEETVGDAKRDKLSFRPDKSARVPQADYADYKGSGWDKGHMAPAADFKWSQSAMDDTFYFTNCCPQDPTLNRSHWEKLESRVRD